MKSTVQNGLDVTEIICEEKDWKTTTCILMEVWVQVGGHLMGEIAQTTITADEDGDDKEETTYFTWNFTLNQMD